MFCVVNVKLVLYLPSQIRFRVGGEHVTGRWSILYRKATTFVSHVIRSCSLKPRRICEPTDVKKNIFSQFLFFYFWVEGYNKTVTEGSGGKHWVLFPLDLNVPLGVASGNIKGVGETKLTVFRETVIKCLLIHLSSLAASPFYLSTYFR